MPLPASGAISLSQVNEELGLSSTAQISFNDINVRRLFIVSQSLDTQISLNEGYGDKITFDATVAAGTTSLPSLRTVLVNAGWDQWRRPIVTLSGNFNATSTGAYGLEINGSFPNNISVTIPLGSGIYGVGGVGGPGRSSGGGGGSGSFGGSALLVGITAGQTLSITNNGTIAGGGGGGGGGAAGTRSYTGSSGSGEDISFFEVIDAFGGGGGGGGQSNSSRVSFGGVGGVASGANQYGGNYSGSAGGSGADTGVGLGGSGGGYVASFPTTTYRGGNGGNGGIWGQPGFSGGSVTNLTVAWGAGGGGAAGSAVIKNSGTISWVANGTRYGSFPAS